MPKVANYFVRPEGVTLSPATVKDVQYGEKATISLGLVSLFASYCSRDRNSLLSPTTLDTID